MATPSHHPHRVGGWWALAGRESAARSFCSSGSQAQLETVYGWAVPNFAACSPVVQQHDHGKDHRGTHTTTTHYYTIGFAIGGYEKARSVWDLVIARVLTERSGPEFALDSESPS